MTGVIRFTAFTFLIGKIGDYPQKIWDGMMCRKNFLINTQKLPVLFLTCIIKYDIIKTASAGNFCVYTHRYRGVEKMYPRKQYLDQLIRKKDNGRVKIITGLRRCGKSVLLFQLYRDYLLSEGAAPEQIIGLALDTLNNARYRNPIELDKYIRGQITDSSKRYYVFIDEIQFVSEIQNPYVDDPAAKLGFIDAVLGLMQIPNADIYVTGSNSRMLSSDILTQFRDRGDEIRVHPLSFAEYYEAYEAISAICLPGPISRMFWNAIISRMSARCWTSCWIFWHPASAP